MRRRRPAATTDARLAAGLTGLLVTGQAVHHAHVGPVEAAAFRAVNRLPDAAYGPGWVVMQAGNVWAAPVTAALAWRCGRREVAGRLLAGGLLAWLLAKIVKRVYRRPRPAHLMAGVTFRGREPSGLGYVSGHAAVATALAVTAYPELGPAGRAGVVLGVPAVAAGRMYVGAHLPLDVLGGVALGLAVEAAVERLTRPGEPTLDSSGPGRPACRRASIR